MTEGFERALSSGPIMPIGAKDEKFPVLSPHLVLRRLGL